MTRTKAEAKAAAAGGKLKVYRNKRLPGGYGTLDIKGDNARARRHARRRVARGAARQRAGQCVACGRRRARRGRLKCAPCAQRQAQYTRASRYGLSAAAYADLTKRQRDRCFACRRPLHRRGFVDHCHKTGRVRALTCNRCNTAEGLVKGTNLVDWAARIIALREPTPVAAVIIGGPRVVRVRRGGASAARPDPL